jgi:DNA-binding response OmpR family regulator
MPLFDSQPAEESSVLIVEDDEVTLEFLSYLFSREGFAVDVARDGRQALDRIASRRPPNFVVLDLMVPYFSGFEILRAIRQRPQWENVPTLILSSKTLEKDIVRALDTGANDYLTKPFKPDELLARLRRFRRNVS